LAKRQPGEVKWHLRASPELHDFWEDRLLGPDPTAKHPMEGFPRVCFIKNTVSNPNIVIGDYTYYDDPVDSEDFERNVLYHYPFVGDRLIIGRFCAIAANVRFVMNGANHLMSGMSTYPFSLMGCGWERVRPELDDLPMKGDTVVGNDVWIGREALIMPGVHIGDGAIIASCSVVVSDVDAYAIVGGNPAKPIRKRFPDGIIAALEEIAWWDWDADTITRNLEAIVGSDIEVLWSVARNGRQSHSDP
jgi:virginiamycin A acetyltransferase